LLRVFFISIGLGIIGTVVESGIGTGGVSPGEGFTFGQQIIFIWIIASICEEVFFRGLIHGFLILYLQSGIANSHGRLSISIWVAAVIFGLMHFGLLSTGMNIAAVGNIVFFAIILGLFAGYYREQTGSLIPAIMIHALFNIGGSLAGYVIQAL
jgi:membrane protease YdiL (CAAX protease family)